MKFSILFLSQSAWYTVAVFILLTSLCIFPIADIQTIKRYISRKRKVTKNNLITFTVVLLEPC